MGMLILGGWYARRQTSSEEYYLGGRRMGSFVIGVSLFATGLSTVSYLAIPGEMINKGPVILSSLLAAPISFLIVIYLLIPALMKQQVTSAYELLEERTGLSGRLMAVMMFLLLRLAWMGLLTNVAAKAVVVMLGLDASMVPWVVLICCIIAVAYTTTGGLEAVVITDVVQFFLLLSGAILTIVLVSVDMEGGGWIPTSWSPHWDTQPFFSLDPHVRVTMFGAIVGGILGGIRAHGSDQTTIQRFMATGSVRAAVRSILVHYIALLAVTCLLALVGFALLGFYSQNPQWIQGEGGISQQADNLFPQYIVGRLPVGVAGLVVAALFAAAMSSLDSGINSVTAVIQVDLIDRFRLRRDVKRHSLKLARWLSLVIGAVIILMSSFVDQVPGNIVEVTEKVSSLLATPLFSLFVLALFVRFTTPFGAVLGTVYGLAASALVAYWDMITHGDPITFQWITPISLTVNIVAGALLSLLPTRGRRAPALVLYVLAAVFPVILLFLWAFSLRSAHF
jgi:SSS family solute:Na+ symporter